MSERKVDWDALIEEMKRTTREAVAALDRLTSVIRGTK